MSKKRLLLLLALTLPLLLLGTWRHRVNVRRAAEAAAFFSYVDGPLSDYSLAITRLESDLPDAKRSSARSAESLKALLRDCPDGWIKARFEFVLPLHERTAALIAALPVKPAAKPAWIAEQKAILEKVIYTLEDVRYSSFQKWKIPKDRFLELNALIFSLKEALSSTM